MKKRQKSDAEVQQDVIRELSWDTRLAPAEVGVEVKDGIVTLSGTVDSWAKLRGRPRWPIVSPVSSTWRMT